MKLGFLCGVCLVMLAVGSVAYSAQMGLAVAWLFEEGSGKSTVDAVRGLEGQFKGTAGWAAEGRFGRGVEFPGKGDSYIWVPHDDIFDAAPYTLTVWTKLNPASWQYVAWKDGEAWPEVHLKRHIDIWIHDADYPVVMWHNEGGGPEGRLDGKAIIADSEWHHLAVVYDGKVMQLYIDGVLDGENTGAGQIAINGEDPLWIGARPGDVAATGIMDEFGFFTQALTEPQIATVMSAGLAELASVESKHKLAVLWGRVKLGQSQ